MLREQHALLQLIYVLDKVTPEARPGQQGLRNQMQLYDLVNVLDEMDQERHAFHRQKPMEVTTSAKESRLPVRPHAGPERERQEWTLKSSLEQPIRCPT
jgi:hypothetical protein